MLTLIKLKEQAHTMYVVVYIKMSFGLYIAYFRN